jgi:hypothetical protein
MTNSYLHEFTQPEPLFDRFSVNNQDALDVVIPIQNTNTFFRRNLLSIYRELPVNRLLIGDGGSADNSLEILKEFPRVTVLDHSNLISLGGSLKDLFMKVETETFAYLHSDVYLPMGFYEQLKPLDLKNHWLESNRHSLIVHEETSNDYFEAERPYSGAQFGDAKLIKSSIETVEDDFLFRNEDLVIAELIRARGGKFKKVENLKHLHQSITKNLANEPALNVSVTRLSDPKWEIATADNQYKGIVKYTMPQYDETVSYLVGHVNANLRILASLDALVWEEVIDWVTKVNPKWLSFLERP